VRLVVRVWHVQVNQAGCDQVAAWHIAAVCATLHVKGLVCIPTAIRDLQTINGGTQRLDGRVCSGHSFIHRRQAQCLNEQKQTPQRCVQLGTDRVRNCSLLETHARLLEGFKQPQLVDCISPETLCARSAELACASARPGTGLVAVAAPFGAMSDVSAAMSSTSMWGAPVSACTGLMTSASLFSKLPSLRAACTTHNNVQR
jgi:hypothetical protein